MNTLSVFKSFSFRRSCLCAVLFAFMASQLQAQTKPVYKISVYEYNHRRYFNMHEQKYKYEIRSLFVKKGDGWVENNDDSLAASYRLVYRRQTLSAVTAKHCVTYHDYDTAGNLKKETTKDYGFFVPRPSIPLNANYMGAPFEKDDDVKLIKKACFLSNNQSFTQNIKLVRYLPTVKEKQWLLDTLKIYLESLFRSNHACIKSEGQFIDTIIEYVVKNQKEIVIDSSNSFIDAGGGKIINVLFPCVAEWHGYHHPFGGIYPFRHECFREDNAFGYYTILCHVDKSGKLLILHDELQYLDHGDFDDDGKDEYLFWTCSHNHAGYVMYYDDFTKSVSDMWTYH